MADYIGLQGIFNALAGGGANAVNLYAQEKDRQRRLDFQQRQFDADQAYRQKGLEQNSRQMDQVDRKIDLTEEAFRDEQETKRRKELIAKQEMISGNAAALAGQRGFNSRFDFFLSDDPDAQVMLQASVGNLASKERGLPTEVRLLDAGVNEDGEKLYQTSFVGKKGKQQNFGLPSTKRQLATQVRAMNVSYGIIDHLAAAGIGIETRPDGEKVLVNEKGPNREFDAEQQQVVADLDTAAMDSVGVGVQEIINNPPQQVVQEALAAEDTDPPQGLAYEGMPAGERPPPVPAPLSRLTAAGYPDMTELGPVINARRQEEEDVRQARAGRANRTRILPPPMYANPAASSVVAAQNTTQDDVVDQAQPSLPTQPQRTSNRDTETTDKATQITEKATEEITKPEISPRRRAAIFASQVQAMGGDMSSADNQKMYQSLLNPQTSTGISADAARLLSEQRALRKERREAADQQTERNQATVSNFSKRFSEIQMANMGFTNPEDITYNVIDTAAKNKPLLALSGLPTDINMMNDTQLARYLDMVEESMRANNKGKGGLFSRGRTNTRGTLSNKIIPTEIAAESFFKSRTPEAQNVMIEEAGSLEAAIRMITEDYKKQLAKADKTKDR